MNRDYKDFETYRSNMGAGLNVDDLCMIAKEADVYIAGPLDNVGERYQNGLIAMAIRSICDLKVFVPQELNDTYTRLNKKLGYETTYPVDMAAINNCKIAVVEVTRQDPGTIAELGYLLGRKKHDDPTLQIIVLQSNPFEELNFYVNGMIHDEDISKLITVPKYLDGNPNLELEFIGKSVQDYIAQYLNYRNHF